MVASPWTRRLGIIFALSAGIANVSSQFSLVINSLIYPPGGSFLLFQNTTATSAVNIVHMDKGMNISYGWLGLPLVTGDYVLSRGDPNTTWEGGQIIYKNFNGALYPWVLTTPKNMLYTCPPMAEGSNVTGPFNVECKTALENEQLALVILSFIREAITIGLFGYWCTKKQQWMRNLAGVVDSSAMGVLWYTACLTQAKYREALDQKKLPPPEWFERTSNFTDLATTIVSLIIASSTVHPFAEAGFAAPGAYTAQCVTGSLGMATLFAQFFMFLKAMYQSRNGGGQAQNNYSGSGKTTEMA